MRLGAAGQYFGLARHLHDSVQATAHLGGAAVHLLDGRELAAAKTRFLACSNCCAPGRPTGVLPGMTRRAGGALALLPARQRDAATPLRARRHARRRDPVHAAQYRSVARAGQGTMLVLVTLVAALGLAVASRRIFAPPGPVRTARPFRRARWP